MANDLDRTMLAEWSGRAAQLLAPVIDAMVTELRRSDRLQMDETTVPVLAPGTGEVRTDWLWVVLRDQRGWGGGDPPIVVFHHARSRAGKVAQEILKGFSGGTLLVDGHGGYDQLADPKKTARPWDIARAIVLEPMANDSALLDALAAPLRQVRQGYAVGNLRRDGRAHCAALCHRKGNPRP